MQKKVIIKQRDQKDCGVCCLESIIKYYDGYIPIEKIREDTLTNTKGTSAYHMIEALKTYGFDAYGTKVKKEEFFKSSFPLPAIVHVVLDNGLNHYMVLYEKRKNKVILMDPANGKKVMDEADFFWIWSEILLIAYPKEKIKIYGKEKNSWTLMNLFLGKDKYKLNGIILMNFVFVIFGIISSFYLKISLSYLNRKEELYCIIGFFFIIIIVKILLFNEVLTKTKSLNARLGVLHSMNFLEHLFNRPLSIYKKRSISDYLLRFWENLELKFIYTEVYKTAIISIISIFGCFYLLININDTFFHFFLFVFIFYGIIEVLFQSKYYKIEKQLLKEKANFQRNLQEYMNSLEVYHYLNLKPFLKKKNEQNLIKFLIIEERKNKTYFYFLKIQNLLKEITSFVFLTLGIYLIQKDKLTVLNFFMIHTISNYIINSLENMINLIPKEKYLKNILINQNEFLLIEEEQNKKNLNFQKGMIEFINVSYSYNSYHWILKDLNLKILEGEHVLLLGKNGSGKSTICKLLTNTIFPNMGEIKINNLNIQDLNINSLHTSVVYLNQGSKLISGSIKENIIFGRPFHQKKYLEICEICQIEDIVKKRPLRYETTINSEENNLSGGERQRIMLARTLYSNGEIFLLDESLSEVDEKLEKEIIKKIRVFLKNKTIIYISHRNIKTLFDEFIKLEVMNERVLIS